MTKAERRAQVELLLQWEKFCMIPSQSHAASALGLAWFTYNRYRTGQQLIPVTVLLAMRALAHGLTPWGEELVT